MNELLQQSARDAGFDLSFSVVDFAQMTALRNNPTAAEMKDVVKDQLRRFELFENIGAADFYATIGSAVDAYLEEHAVDWKP